MRYKNIKTGSTIETECIISGAEWKKDTKIKGKKKEKNEAENKSEAEQNENE